MSESATVSRAFITRASEFLVGDYLPKIERCLEKLTDEQIWWRANEESNSIGNLILHLCGNARQWIICGVGSQPDNRNRDSEFQQRHPIPRTELLTLLRSTLSEIQTTLGNLDPTTVLDRRKIQGHDVDILEAIFHVTEHFSMHSGQIIMLTKMLTSSDLRFYGFEDGVPVERWRSQPSGSS
ncbi:MAG TPA: DinB family protein [Pyrinomonadaceae bacterium]|nr:DinB family protein [Pyrinomonadaceae bacterium]